MQQPGTNQDRVESHGGPTPLLCVSQEPLLCTQGVSNPPTHSRARMHNEGF